MRDPDEKSPLVEYRVEALKYPHYEPGWRVYRLKTHRGAYPIDVHIGVYTSHHRAELVAAYLQRIHNKGEELDT